MATRSSEFEFLLTAPRRFDGGPEVEWIQWLEEQAMQQQYYSQNMSQKAVHAELKFAELEKERQLQRSQAILSSQAQQFNRQAPQVSQKSEQPIIVKKTLDEISFISLLFSPFYHLVLASCGLFVSTVIFRLVFGKESQKEGKYKTHNDLVYQQSITVFKASLKSIVKLPVRLVKKAFGR